MITVIVPYKNASKWIKRCIDSLKAQPEDAEFLFVSDYDKKVRMPKDKRFKLIENEHTPGVSGARNTGLDHAQGDWITFLDADDEMLPKGLWLYGCMIAKGGSQIWQANHYRYYAEKDLTAFKYRNAGGDYPLSKLPQCWCMVWNKLYAAELVKDIRFDEALKYGEDELFNLECLAKQKFIRHSSGKAATVKRNFDNKKSLSRIKGLSEILLQSTALMEYIARADDVEMKDLTRGVLAEHWGSDTYKEIIRAEGANK